MNRLKKIALISVFSMLLLTACKEKELSISTFGDVTEEHSMRIIEIDNKDTRVEKWSRASSDDIDLKIEFIECKSESNAASLYNEQVKYLQDKVESQTVKGTTGNGSYSLNANGYYYQIVRKGVYVLYAAGPSSSASVAKQIFDELP